VQERLRPPRADGRWPATGRWWRERRQSMCRGTASQPARPPSLHRQTDTHTDRQTVRRSETKAKTQTDIHPHTYRHTAITTQTDRQTQTQTQTQTDTHMEFVVICCCMQVCALCARLMSPQHRCYASHQSSSEQLTKSLSCPVLLHYTSHWPWSLHRHTDRGHLGHLSH